MQQASSNRDRHEETFECEEEVDDLERDLRAKQQQHRHSTAAHRIVTHHSTSSSIDEHTKVQLAKRASQASVPGIEHYESFNDRCCNNTKPSQDQLQEMGYWRRIQKNRRAEQSREDRVPEPLDAREEQPIDMFQGRMNDFRKAEDQMNKDEEEILRMLKRKIVKWFLIVMLVGLLIVGTAVGVAVGLVGSSKREGGDSMTTDTCYTRNDTHPSDRFIQLRDVLSSARGWDPSTIDSAGSIQRAALCWLSDFDTFESEIANATQYEVVQRFALAAISYRVSFTIKPELTWKHVCEWDLVACDGPNNRVTDFFLTKGTRIPIPEEIALLTDLIYLRFTKSHLTGQIPSTLSFLSHLQVLDLHGNELTGSIPSELGILSELRQLDLDQNGIRGEIPRQLFAIPSLRVLGLANNFLTGMLPNELGTATGLETLAVQQNVLRGTIPDISRLTNLQHLQLSENHGMLSSFPDISRLTNLVSLVLSYFHLSGTIPSSVWRLSSLEYLHLQHTEISGTISADVEMLTSLQLRLSVSELVGSIPTTLGNLSDLRVLDLSTLDLTGTVPTELGQLSSLVVFNLENTNLYEIIPSEVCDLGTVSTASAFSSPTCGGDAV